MQTNSFIVQSFRITDSDRISSAGLLSFEGVMNQSLLQREEFVQLALVNITTDLSDVLSVWKELL